jgi:hypothetical protein
MYTDKVELATCNGEELDPESFTQLNANAKAEVALVIFVFQHMNQGVSAIMGEQMSTAMFSFPHPIT